MKNLFFTFLLLLPFSAHAEAPHWVINSAQSHLAFDGTQMGQKFSGEFKKFSGDIVFDPAHLEQSRAAVTVDITSVTTDDGDANKYIGAPEWFDSEKFPTAKFTTNKIEKAGDGFIAHGNLTIRDITLPADLPFHLKFSPDGKQAEMQGSAKLNRLNFHLGSGSWADTETVGADVTVRMNVTADKTP